MRVLQGPSDEMYDEQSTLNTRTRNGSIRQRTEQPGSGNLQAEQNQEDCKGVMPELIKWLGALGEPHIKLTAGGDLGYF